MRAVWNGEVLAESDEVQVVEGNVYFPPTAVRREFFEPSDTVTHCPWKGNARYYTLRVNGATNRDAAWYYPEPKPAAANIKDHVAFWQGVVIER